MRKGILVIYFGNGQNRLNKEHNSIIFASCVRNYGFTTVKPVKNVD